MDQISLVATLGEEVLPPQAHGSVAQAVGAIYGLEGNAIGRGISYRNYIITVNGLQSDFTPVAAE